MVKLLVAMVIILLMISVKGCSQDLFFCRLRQKVSCKLPGNELIVGHVGIERPDEEVAIVAGTSAEDRLFVATPAEGHVELGAEAFLAREPVQGDFAPTFERGQLRRSGGG